MFHCPWFTSIRNRSYECNTISSLQGAGEESSRRGVIQNLLIHLHQWQDKEFTSIFYLSSEKEKEGHLRLKFGYIKPLFLPSLLPTSETEGNQTTFSIFNLLYWTS